MFSSFSYSGILERLHKMFYLFLNFLTHQKVKNHIYFFYLKTHSFIKN